jgi:hypothetical protein
MVDDDGFEQWGPTRLIDDGSLRLLRQRSKTLDGSLPVVVEAPPAVVRRRRLPRGLRYWALPVVLIGGLGAWSSLRAADEAAPPPAESTRVVMPVAEPAAVVDEPAPIEVPLATPAPKAKPATKAARKLARATTASTKSKTSATKATPATKSPRAKRAALRRGSWW